MKASCSASCQARRAERCRSRDMFPRSSTPSRRTRRAGPRRRRGAWLVRPRLARGAGSGATRGSAACSPIGGSAGRAGEPGRAPCKPAPLKKMREPKADRRVRVLMLGWEYPPRFAGGLGKACQGLAQGLAKQGAQVFFVLPTFPERVTEQRLEVVGALEALLESGWDPAQASSRADASPILGAGIGVYRS